MRLSFTRASGEAAFIVADACVAENHVEIGTLSEHPVDEGANISDHVRHEAPSLSVDLVFSNTPVNLGPDSYYDGAIGAVSTAQFEVSRPLVRRRSGDPVLSDPGQESTTVRDASGPAANLLNFVPQTGRNPISTALNYAVNVKVPGRRPTWRPQPEETQSIVEQFSTLQFDRDFDRVGAIYKELLEIKNKATLVKAETSLRVYENMVILGINPTRDSQSGNILKVTVDLKQARIASSKTVQVTKPLQTRGNKTKNKGVQPPKEPTPAEEKRASESALKMIKEYGFNFFVKNF